MLTVLTAAFVLASAGTTIGLAIRGIRAEIRSARLRDRIGQYTN